ncbi:MAG TPA: amidohydrolase family protein, partial [Xanthobacteraceae bacterium]|nr:amidohydrolase family protein [Xanthobacteraceae bacterium]
MADNRATIIRGGQVTNAGGSRAAPADILIAGDSIAEVGSPGLAAPSDAVVIDARDRLMHPGLINAHMHGHGNLAKGMGDRWTLELLLAAGPWITGGRTLEDKYLTTYVGAIEMLLKGCTACYDLTVEFPLPSVEGLEACGRAYADAGMRAVLAPMVAEYSFYEAIPGLLDAMPPALQKEVERLRLAPGDATLKAMRAAMHGWKFDRAQVRPAVAPTIPHHCSDDFMRNCATLAREFDVALHSHVQESKTQVIVGLKRYGKTQTAHLDDLGLLGPNFTVGHGVWLDYDDMQRL